MAILKGFYYQPKRFGSMQTWTPSILDVNIMDLLNFFSQDHNDLQCSMGYGPTHVSQSNVQTLEAIFFQSIVMWLILSS
jgi:hypothetical protein